MSLKNRLHSERTPVTFELPLQRRSLLIGAATGVTALALPRAAAHASLTFEPDGAGGTTSATSFDGLVSAMAQHDVGGIDALVLSGSYSADSDGFPGRLTRIVPTDLLDTAFDTKTTALMAGHRANSIAVQADGALVAVGARSGSESALVVRVAADGTPDTTFNANVPTIAGGNFTQGWDVLVRTDGVNAGKILIAGDFKTAAPPGDSVLNRTTLLQLNADGSLDTDFMPDWTHTSAGGPPVGRALLVLPDGDIILGGFNLELGGEIAPGLLRIDGTTGTRQRRLSGDISVNVTRAVLLSDGSVLGFSTGAIPSILRFDPDPTSGGPISPELALVAITPEVPGQVRSLVTDGTDAFIIGGQFTTIADTSRSNLARIAITGLGAGETPALTVDPDFTTPTNNTVWSVVRRRDDSLAIAGAFTQVDGQVRARYARLSASGALL